MIVNVIVDEMPKLLDLGIITIIWVNSNYMDVFGGIWCTHDVWTKSMYAMWLSLWKDTRDVIITMKCHM